MKSNLGAANNTIKKKNEKKKRMRKFVQIISLIRKFIQNYFKKSL